MFSYVLGTCTSVQFIVSVNNSFFCFLVATKCNEASWKFRAILRAGILLYTEQILSFCAHFSLNPCICKCICCVWRFISTLQLHLTFSSLETRCLCPCDLLRWRTNRRRTRNAGKSLWKYIKWFPRLIMAVEVWWKNEVQWAARKYNFWNFVPRCFQCFKTVI